MTTLREGFTTGTAAAAAASAGAIALLTDREPDEVSVALPTGKGTAAGSEASPEYTVPVAGYERLPQGVRVRVIKDGGDDPDVTHGKPIEAVVVLKQQGPQGEVLLLGGRGVGRVTLPGLPVAVGEPAINPKPREQICAAVRQVCRLHGYTGAVQVTIEVPEGEAIARRTMNPRLGIVGGISILGTRGTVKPFSHESYRASIAQGMDVAKAQGAASIALTTGGRTERLLLSTREDISPLACVQIADFFEYSLKAAVEKGYDAILIACFFGKLVKMAQGIGYTHAKDNAVDFDLLAALCAEQGVDAKRAEQVRFANTARHALDCIAPDPARNLVLDAVMHRAAQSARAFAGQGPDITCYLFDFDDTLLCTQHHSGAALHKEVQ